jgi:hypothetical protein
MALEAELFDGTILEFPDGTEPSVIQATAKRLTAERQAKTEAPKVEEPKTPEKPSLLAGTTLPADAGPMGNREISEVGTAPLPILKDLPKFDVSKMETAEERAKREYGYTPEMTPLETAARFGKRAITAGGVGLMQGYLGVDRFALDMLGVDSSKISDTTGQLEKIQRAKGEASNYALKITEGAISSIAQQVPALVGGVATGSAVVPLAMMFGQSFGQTYDESRREGLDVGDSTGRAAAFGALEVIGEKFGLGNVLDGIKASAKGMPIKDIAAHFAKALVKEIPGEQLTYAGQFAVDKGYGMNPEAGVKEFIQGAIDTLAQTVVQGGIMMGAGSAASKVARQINKNAPEEKDKVPTARELMEQQGFMPPTKEEPQVGGAPLVNAPPAPPEEEKGPGVLQNIKDKLSEGLSADVEKAKGLWSKITGKTPEATNEFETLVADYEKQGMNRDSAVMLATQDFKETGRGDQLITGAREPSLQTSDLETTAQGSATGAAGTESGQLGGTGGAPGSTGVGNEAQRGALNVPQNLIDLQAKSIAADEANKVSSTGANKRNATMAARRLGEAKAAQLGLTYEDYLKESDPQANTKYLNKVDDFADDPAE